MARSSQKVGLQIATGICSTATGNNINNIGCSLGEVKMFDSLMPKGLTRQSTGEAKCPVQRQAGTCDCGLFALAFATSLCNGILSYSNGI